ncbi:MAG: hypothetical protein KAH01_08685 [Caldisericia bacterium]|nr:hypothetical protein [Caldisericia bacterium]
MRTYRNSKKTKNNRAIILWITLSVILAYTSVVLTMSHSVNTPKKNDFTLNISSKKVPFLIRKQDNINVTKTVYYLGLWDLEKGTIVSDSMPICNVEGDCKIFWNGNSRIYVTASYGRGQVLVEPLNSYFSVVQLKINNPSKAFVLDDPTSDRFYVLDKSSSSKSYLIKSWVRGKINQEFTINFDSDDMVDFLPLAFVWKDKKPFILAESYEENTPFLHFGVIEKNKIEWSSTESILDWNKNERDHKRIQLYEDSILLSQSEPVNVQSYSLSNPKLNNFETVNNYVDMFYQYLFGSSSRESALARRGIYLTKPKAVYPSLGLYKDILITQWKPEVSRIVGKKRIQFPVFQFQSIRNQKLVSRIDQVNNSINVYSAFSANEIDANETGIDFNFWIMPGQ